MLYKYVSTVLYKYVSTVLYTESGFLVLTDFLDNWMWSRGCTLNDEWAVYMRIGAQAEKCLGERIS